MTQSINELKSYTEYNVSTPTSVFTIGFQYEYNVDHVIVYVDGVEATAAGYTVQHDSHGTISLTPAVPNGVVRLVRETDIDTSAHTFSAGAKFTAGNMDENFQQIRHAQQEVLDGFSKLSTDTYEIIDALQDVAQSAQDAADAANDAAEVANDAATQVSDKVDRSEGAALPYNPALTYAENAVVVKDGVLQQWKSGVWVNVSEQEVKKYLISAGIDESELDSDYDFLMQQIAAIAVDKGWDASFIADASGQNQQSLNNGFESIAQLRATNPLGKGFRVYVKSYHPDLNQGGGYFVSTQKTGLVDNGVTIFASQNPLIFWVRSGVREVTPFMAGAKGDRVQDDQPAFMSALAVGLPVKVEKSANGYRLAAPVSLTPNQVLEGDRERIQVYIDHDGAAFKLTSYGTLKNFEPMAFDVARRFTYDAVVIGESGTSIYYISNIIDNIKPFHCKNSFVLRGGAYWNTFTNTDCFQFRDNGIWLVNDGRAKNNNYFQFKQIASNAQADGQGHYSYNEITWDQTCIRVFGDQNTFIGGEHAPAKIGLWIEGASSGNRFIGMYGEHQKIPIRTEAGSENFYDSTCSMGTPEIHPDSIIYGQSGKDNTRHARLGIAPIAAQKELKALWFFNEGNGTKVLDNSGNRKHLTVVNPVWSNNGRWGKTVELDPARSTYINPIPLDTLDWTQPFTFAACVRITDDSRSNPVLAFRTSDTSYSTLFASRAYWSVVDYDKATVQTTAGSKMSKSPQDGYSWIVIYFDPVNKTLTNLDTEYGIGVVSIPSAPRFSAWVAGISSVVLGTHFATGLGGSLSFVGFWQRRLNMSEVSDLVNMKVPNLFPNAAPAVVSNQADSTATDVNALKADFNALLAKMRDAGIML